MSALRLAKASRSSTPLAIRNSHHSTSLSPESSVLSRSKRARRCLLTTCPPPASPGAAQMPGTRPRERLDAVARKRKADARVAVAAPGQPWADAIAAVPVQAAGVDAREDGLRTLR